MKRKFFVCGSSGAFVFDHEGRQVEVTDLDASGYVEAADEQEAEEIFEAALKQYIEDGGFSADTCQDDDDGDEDSDD